MAAGGGQLRLALEGKISHCGELTGKVTETILLE
jgi:hypothetical protein